MSPITERAASLKLVPILEASYDDKMAVLAMRNEPDVRKNMYRAAVITEAEHRRWLEGLKENSSTQIYLVHSAGKLIGSLGFTRIDNTHRRADWSFYLGKTARGRGLGKALELRALDLAFGPMGFYKLNCEVISTNAAVLALHHHFGFVVEGSRRAHVWRDGIALDADLLGLTAPEWEKTRSRIIAMEKS